MLQIPPRKKVHIKNLDGHMDPEIQKATEFTNGVGRAVKIVKKRIKRW